MRAAIVALFTTIALMTSVLAQSRKVLVLPLDGTTPAAQRNALNASVAKLAKTKLGGDVSIGETTFNETAAAVGCSPELASCAEQVRTTLAVDELVYGSANTADGNTTVTVMRASAGSEPRTQISVIKDTDPASSAESNMDPLFGAPGDGSAAGSGEGSGSATPRTHQGVTFFSTTERKLAVGLFAAGAIGLVIGLSLWSGASSLQDDIDAHPKATLAQINDLKALEDRAGSKALWGNIFVVLGIAAGGAGGYFLWKDRNNRATATVAPAPAESGAGMTFVLRGRW